MSGGWYIMYLKNRAINSETGNWINCVHNVKDNLETVTGFEIQVSKQGVEKKNSCTEEMILPFSSLVFYVDISGCVFS
jgi:hypothetical protein